GRRDSATLAAGVAGGAGFAAAFALALSWPVYPPMALPGVALVAAAVIGHAPPSPRRRWLGAALAAGLAVVLAAGVAWQSNRPSEWGGWAEPPLSKADTPPELEELAGFRLSP